MKALLVSIDAELRKETIAEIQAANVDCTENATVEEALRSLACDSFDVILLDDRLAVPNAVAQLARASCMVDVVVLAREPTVQGALEAMREGAKDYFSRSSLTSQLAACLQRLRSGVSPWEIPLRTQMPEMRQALDHAFRSAVTDAPIMIRGESGVGKSLLARAIHSRSRRSGAPFIVVQCPATFPGLLRWQLTGRQAGTDGQTPTSKNGKLAAAVGGTLVLDHLGDLPPAGQDELVAVIEGEWTGSLPTRIVATTSHDLSRGSRQFRPDLLSRLKVVEVVLLPLRDRPADILPLAELFLRAYSTRYHIQVPGFTEEVKDSLQKYSWPGNVRELSNVIERAVATGTNFPLSLEDLPTNVVHGPSGPTVELGGEYSLDEIEAEHIRRVLKKSPSIEKASALLGVDQSTLWRKRKRLNL